MLSRRTLKEVEAIIVAAIRATEYSAAAREARILNRIYLLEKKIVNDIADVNTALDALEAKQNQEFQLILTALANSAVSQHPDIVAIIQRINAITAANQTEITNVLDPAQPAPTVTGFSPTSGAVGDSITISGTNLDVTGEQHLATFNGVTAAVQSFSANALVALVPDGATSGPIAVTVGTQSATSADSFTVNAPAGP